MWVLRDPTWGREGTLEMVCQDDLEALDLPVIDYVRGSRQHAVDPRDPYDVVSCTPDELMGVIIERMLHEGVHHVYVVENGSPTGVVSFVDILRAFSDLALNF